MLSDNVINLVDYRNRMILNNLADEAQTDLEHQTALALKDLYDGGLIDMAISAETGQPVFSLNPDNQWDQEALDQFLDWHDG